ncbi:hypothetical protein MKW98_019727 [Papaver atlanticum]|uniref:Ethylene receptor n=1 Tax=Papaver atlanticum TaxID=357466 RepID=A0AAD4TCT7_9MAGN|nr:hypothetical protein MKW98_019727 [Papaver atlanticum]
MLCSCYDEADTVVGMWTLDDIHHLQKVSDLLIATAYFSIPLELFYFVSCSIIFPFKWMLTQFGAFIILCGLTHFLTIFTYDPHTYKLMLSLTILKSLTAIVSCITSITFVTLIPMLLKVMIREGLLIKKTEELDREMVLIKKQEETSYYVRMLTQEIRRSLDRHTILYTTLVELSKVLFLENCVILMPDEDNFVMNFTHELRRRGGFVSVRMDDPEVVEIVRECGVRILGSGSRLSGLVGRGSGVAIRMPLLNISSFNGGTPKTIEPCCYAVLVLVLPVEVNRCWNSQELEIVEVVADQVAVALSHAAVLEESLLIKEQLVEQNIALRKARKMALMANEAKCSFRSVMSREMISPARSIASVLSVLQLENFKSEEQKRMVDTIAKGGLLISAIVEDATGVSGLSDSRLELKSRNFSLYSMLKEAASISKFMCACKKSDFEIIVSELVPDRVIGDETRILQAILYMVGKILGAGDCDIVVLQIYAENDLQDGLDPRYFGWKQDPVPKFTYLHFEVCRRDLRETGGSSLWMRNENEHYDGNPDGGRVTQFNICEKLAELMQGSVSVNHSPYSLSETMNFRIRLQLQRSEGLIDPMCKDPETARSVLEGMNTLLLDRDGFNQSITKKLLEKLECHITVVSSWYQCAQSLLQDGNTYHLLLLDIGMLKEEGHWVFDTLGRLSTRPVVIAMTALKSDRVTRDWCIQNGINGVICKPVILQEMEDELHRIFQLARKTRSPPVTL